MSVHVLFHDHANDKDHCPVCEVSFVFNHLPYIGSDGQVKISNIICYEKHINLFNYYSLIIDEKPDAATIVNRPPPSKETLS